MNMVYPYNEISASKKKKGIKWNNDSCYTYMHEPQTHYAKWKKTHRKDYVLYDSIHRNV